MRFTPYWLDTSRQEPDRCTIEVGGDVDVPVVGAVLTDQDVADVYLARGALESAAIRAIIARGLMETAHEGLDQHVTEMETAAAAGDRAAVATFDREFHTALVAAAASPRLQRLFTTVISSELRVCLGVVRAVGLGRTPSRDTARSLMPSVKTTQIRQLSTAAGELRCLS